MIKLKELIKEHTWDREFGDPLPTFEDVMEKHQVNKLKEGWWDSMSDKAQAAYIKKHGEAPNVAGDDDDYDKGPDMDSRDYDMDDDDDKYDKYGQEMGGTPSKSSGEPEDKPFGGDTGKDADIDYVDPDDIDDLPEPEDEEPSGEPEGGEQNIPSDDEIDSYQEKLNTYTGPYSDGNEIHTKWEGITTKVWAETSEEAYKDEPDHPLNKPSDSKWADTVGEEVRALATAHFSEFGDELKDASPEAKAYFKEKGLPPSDEEGEKEESITINGKQYIPIKDSVEPKKHLLRETYERIGGK